VAVRTAVCVAVCGSARSSMRQCAAVHDSVAVRDSRAVCDNARLSGSAAVCGSARGSVQQCGGVRQCAATRRQFEAVRAVVCDSTCSSVWQYAR
jgi:hypothetical protein